MTYCTTLLFWKAAGAGASLTPRSSWEWSYPGTDAILMLEHFLLLTLSWWWYMWSMKYLGPGELFPTLSSWDEPIKMLMRSCGGSSRGTTLMGREAASPPILPAYSQDLSFLKFIFTWIILKFHIHPRKDWLVIYIEVCLKIKMLRHSFCKWAKWRRGFRSAQHLVIVVK